MMAYPEAGTFSTKTDVFPATFPGRTTVAKHIPNTQMKNFLMKILLDESPILRLSPNLEYGVVKISSGMLQDEQAGVLIIKLKGSTLAKLRNHDLVTTPAQDSLN